MVGESGGLLAGLLEKCGCSGNADTVRGSDAGVLTTKGEVSQIASSSMTCSEAYMFLFDRLERGFRSGSGAGLHNMDMMGHLDADEKRQLTSTEVDGPMVIKKAGRFSVGAQRDP